VLESIAATLGSVPRVLLRDSDPENGAEALVKPHSSEMPALAGRPIRFRLLGEIARGGMGAILKGRDEDLGRDLAVKVLLEAHRNSPELICRFIEEAQIGGQLQHPGIVPIHELGMFPDGRPYFSMKLVKGKTLGELLTERKHEGRNDPAGTANTDARMEDLPRFLKIFEDACQTVAYAHSHGVVHRDLKPSNVMVGSFGEVQIMDWGLAKVLPRGGVVEDESAGKLSVRDSIIATARSGSEIDHSIAGSVMGTPSYMAPEQARGEVALIDGRADVFALGAILCEILTGQPPFTGRTSPEILKRAASADLTESHAVLDSCGADPDLISLAKDCLAAAIEQRPRDARAVRNRITAHLSGVQEKLRAVERSRAVAEARAVEERKRGRLRLALTASILGTFALGLGVLVWLDRQRAGRRDAATRLVDDALDKATALRAEAESNDSIAIVRLVAALGEVKRAEDLVRDAELSPVMRDRVARAKDNLTRLQRAREERAREAAQRSNLQKALVDLRVQPGDDWGRIQAGQTLSYPVRYAAAFQEAGIDLADPRAAETMRNSDMREDFIAALENWNRSLKKDNPIRARNLALIDRIDDSGWRRTVRSAIQRGDTAELKKLATSDETRAQPPALIVWLSTALGDSGLQPEAERALRSAQRRYPDDFWINYDLGRLLMNTRRRNEAKGYLMAAVASRPSSPAARFYLAMVQVGMNDVDEAIRTLRLVDQMAPNYFWVPFNLAQLLLREGDLEDALDKSRRAMASYREHHWGHVGLAYVLLRQAKFDEALSEVRAAIQLVRSCENAHACLGEVLSNLGRLDEAIAAFRTAIEFEPHELMNHVSLGDILCLQGRYEDALKEYRIADEKRSKYPGWDFPAAEWIRRCERALALRGRLTAVLEKRDEPRDADEAATFARLCAQAGKFAAATQLWKQAFAMRTELNEQLFLHCRYNLLLHDRFDAACAAAQAGCGLGRDEPPPSTEQQTDLRAQALAWLEEEFPASARVLEANTVLPAKPATEKYLFWLATPALACVRDHQHLARLPDAERKNWEAFWAKVDKARRPQFDPPLR
jgi:serine/threonine-protein kinase